MWPEPARPWKIWRLWDLARHPHDVLLAGSWRLRANLSAYDAAYVALAEALEEPLLTLDARLAAAPGRGTRIDVIARGHT